MSDTEFSDLVNRILKELAEIQRVQARIHSGWEHAHSSSDDLYLDGVALNLHGVYLGVERIFVQIAETVDNVLPQNDNWHELLLKQMINEVPGIRPAVVSAETGQLLDELRRFRHVVRNVYTHNFNPENIGKLIGYANEAFDRLKAELSAFIAFLEQEN